MKNIKLAVVVLILSLVTLTIGCQAPNNPPNHQSQAGAHPHPGPQLSPVEPYTPDTRDDIIRTIKNSLEMAHKSGNKELATELSNKLVNAQVIISQSKMLDTQGKHEEALAVLEKINNPTVGNSGPKNEMEKKIQLVKDLRNRKDEIDLDIKRLEREKKEIDMKLKHLTGNKHQQNKPNARAHKNDKMKGKQNRQNKKQFAPKQKPKKLSANGERPPKEKLEQRLAKINKALENKNMPDDIRKNLLGKKEKIKKALEMYDNE